MQFRAKNRWVALRCQVDIDSAVKKNWNTAQFESFEYNALVAHKYLAQRRRDTHGRKIFVPGGKYFHVFPPDEQPFSLGTETKGECNENNNKREEERNRNDSKHHKRDETEWLNTVVGCRDLNYCLFNAWVACVEFFFWITMDSLNVNLNERNNRRCSNDAPTLCSMPSFLCSSSHSLLSDSFLAKKILSAVDFKEDYACLRQTIK